MKRQDEKIICPKCNHTQPVDIYDLIDPEDTRGSFPKMCHNCEEVFRVSFDFKPFIEETLIKD